MNSQVFSLLSLTTRYEYILHLKLPIFHTQKFSLVMLASFCNLRISWLLLLLETVSSESLLICLWLSINFQGRSHSCTSLKSIGNKVGSMFCCCGCSSITSNANKYRRLDAKLARKIIELRQQPSSSGHKNKKFRSINSVILKFPQLKEQVKNLRGVFEHYGEFLATMPTNSDFICFLFSQ